MSFDPQEPFARVTTFTPGSGVAVIGPFGILFLPQTKVTERLQRLVDRMAITPERSASDIATMLWDSEKSPPSSFAVVEHTAHGVAVFVQGNVRVSVTTVDDDVVEVVDGSGDAPKLVRRFSGRLVVTVGEHETSNFYRSDGNAVLPVAGLRSSIERSLVARGDEAFSVGPVDQLASSAPESPASTVAPTSSVEALRQASKDGAVVDGGGGPVSAAEEAEDSDRLPAKRKPVPMSISELFDPPARRRPRENANSADAGDGSTGPITVVGSEDGPENRQDLDSSIAEAHESVMMQPGNDLGMESGARLGWLEFDDGARVPLDRPIVIGRMPPLQQVIYGDLAQPVIIDDPSRLVSSYHVLVRCEGPNVFVEDQASKNHTWVTTPHGEKTQLLPNEPAIIIPGTVVNMADIRSFTYRTS